MGERVDRRSALRGAVGVLVVEAVLVVVVAVAWVVGAGEGRPDPIATRSEVRGTVTDREPHLGVEVPSDRGDAVDALRCGLVDRGVGSGVAVGDDGWAASSRSSSIPAPVRRGASGSR